MTVKDLSQLQATAAAFQQIGAQLAATFGDGSIHDDAAANWNATAAGSAAIIQQAQALVGYLIEALQDLDTRLTAAGY